MKKLNLFLIIVLIATFLDYTLSDVISPQCENDMSSMMTFNDNAIQMWSYTGRGPNDMGNIDECLQLPMNVSHYCVYQTSMFVPELNLTYAYTMGLCFPPSCNTTQDVNYIIANMTIGLIVAYPGADSQLHCYSYGQNKKDWTTGAGVMLGICIGFAFMVVAGTALDVLRDLYIKWSKKDDEFEGLLDGGRRNPVKVNYESANSIIMSVFLSFSLIQNFNSFVGGASAKRHFDALDGIRTVSTLWVLLGHTLLFSTAPGLDNVGYVFGTVRSFFTFQAIPAGEFAVDIFFMLSGFLVTHTLLAQIDSKRAKSVLFWLKYVIHRFVRLSPLYFFLLFVAWKLAPMFGSGPLWYQFIENYSTCGQYWWTNLLYINNLHPATLNQECFPHAWYLANDMQFYLIAPFVLLAFRYRKSFGYLLCAVLLAICFTTNIWLTIKYNIATFFDFSVTSSSFATDIYSKPWTRIGPYAVGIAVAFLYTHDMTKKLYNNFFFRMIAYALALGITMFFSYIPYSGLQGNPWTKVENALYNAFAHTMFTVGLSFFMVATFYGHGGFLGDFFRLGIFRYFSKLTYSTYLIHPMIVYIYEFSRTTYEHYSPIQFSWLYAGNVVYSFSAAFLVHLCIEKPFVNLERLIFPPNERKENQTENSIQHKL